MISYFTRHPVASNLLMIAMMFLGFTALPSMERETFPEFTSSRVSVSVVYPGASAADVDELLCQELDDALNSISQLDDLECTSVEGRATATLTMSEGGDIGQFYNDIASIASSLNDLPADAEQPSVSILERDEVIAILTVSGIDTVDGLVRYADELARRIGALPMVSTAEVAGISESELKISFDPLALRRYGVSAQQVAEAVAARSLRQPLGTVTTRKREFTLRYADARRNIGDLEDLVVFQDDRGGFVRLSDLATVEITEATPENRSFIDSDRAATIRINKNAADDAIDAFAEVEKLIETERAAYPEPFRIDVIADTTSIIADRINLVLRNTLQGLALVLIVLSLFFSLKDAFWIALTLPVSFLAGLFLMQTVGITINMISLVALLMAVGLIMDDSIVIADNIAKWRTRLGPVDAAVRGTTQVMPGIVSSFLTTASVFGPLMFLAGEFGSVLRIIPMVLLITIAASLVEAFLILPKHLSHGGNDPAANERRLVPRSLERFKNGVVIPATRVFTAWRYLTVGTVFAVLIVTIGLIASGTIKVIGFPSTEGDTIAARFSLSAGIPLTRTEAVVDQLLDALAAVDGELSPRTKDGQPLVERVLVQYASNADVKANGANTATITVDLLTSDERNVAADDVLAAWRRAAGPIPDLVQSNFTQTTLGPGGNDIDVELGSRDLAEVEQAASELTKLLLSRPDVTEVFQDFTGGEPEARLRLTDFGYTIGLTPQSLASQLRTAFAGSDTDTFRESFSNYTVRVELGDSVPTISDLEEFPIVLPDGKQVSLASVVDVTLTRTYPQITRKNGLAIARVVGKIDRAATTSTAISGLVTGSLGTELKQRFPGLSIGIGGATQEQQTTQMSILIALISGLFGVYLVLAFQFRSYVLPVIIMVSIPFALIGSVLGHLLLGLDLSMPSFVGFASLAGVVVNNAILFMAFFQNDIRDGNYIEAAIDAVRQRFRPVLLSSSTTFVGLLPIIFETSPQAQTLVPLVVAVAFGLLASTVLIVFVFPSVIAIYFDFASVEKWLSRRGVDNTEPAEEPAPRPAA